MDVYVCLYILATLLSRYQPLAIKKKIKKSFNK